MALRHNLTQQDIDQVQTLKNEGRVSEAWQYLATNFDTYADDAATVTSKDPNNPLTDFVHTHWENTAPGAYETKFDQVAQQQV